MRASCWVMVLAADEIDATAAQVGRERAEHADGVDAWMSVEASVLDGEHGLLHVRRNGGQRHAASPLARRVGQRAEQRRIERRLGDRPVVEQDAGDGLRTSRGAWARPLGERRFRAPFQADVAPGVDAAARHDLDGVVAGRELPGLARAGAARVAKIVEALDDLAFRKREAGAEGQRAAVDARQDADALAVQPLFDQAGEVPVVVAGGPGGHEDRERKGGNEQARPPPPRPPRPGPGAGGQIVSTQ